MANPPEWLHQFADAVAAQLSAVDMLAPIGCHLFRASEHWEVTLFVSSTEIIGGREDGRQRSSRFCLDIQSLLQIFDSVRSVVWQAHNLGRDDDIGPHVSVEGDYCGHPVWLRVPSAAPGRFPAGRRAHIHRQAWEEIW